MAVAVIKYNLSNPDDKMDFARANASMNMACFIFEVLMNGKRHFKHKENATIDDVFDYLWEEAEIQDINIENLIQ